MRRSCVLIVAAAGLLAQETARAQGGPSPTTPPMAWEEGALGAARPLVLRATNIELKTRGTAWQADLEMRFENTSPETVEGVAWLPVPSTAVERDFRADNNGLTMDSQLRSRDRVIRVYREITRQRERNRDPVVLERVDDHWLRATISPVEGLADVVLTVSYVGLAERLGDVRTLTLPVPTTRGPGGGSAAFALNAAMDGGEGLWLSTPGFDPRGLRRTDEGHQFQLRGTTREGLVTLFYGDREARDPLWVGCHRVQGEEGYVLAELDPSTLLAEPLKGATYLFLLDLPSGTRRSLTLSTRALVQAALGQLPAGSRAAVLTPHTIEDARGRVAALAGEGREWLEELAGSWSPSGTEPLADLCRRALELSAETDGPVRWMVIHGPSSRSGESQVLPEQIRKDIAALEQTSVFTLDLDPAGDPAPMQELARTGHGRAFHAPTEEHLGPVFAALADAWVRPVLRHPVLEMAGVTEVETLPRSCVTYGETLDLSGRYERGTASLLRLRGTCEGRRMDELFEVWLQEECQDEPWVATLWASRRIESLQRLADTESGRAYQVRLSERFRVLGPATAFLALEPAMAGRMPTLVGPGSTPVTSPVAPLPPHPNNPQPRLTSEQPFERWERNLVNGLGGGTNLGPATGTRGGIGAPLGARPVPTPRAPVPSVPAPRSPTARPGSPIGR